MAELRVSGRVASGGFAAGPVAVFSTDAGTARRRRRAGRRDAGVAQRDRLRARAALGSRRQRPEATAPTSWPFRSRCSRTKRCQKPPSPRLGPGSSADRAWRTRSKPRSATTKPPTTCISRRAQATCGTSAIGWPGILSGATTDPACPPGAILVGEDLTPSRFLSMDWSSGGGIALTRGSASGHVATLARARGVPMIVGLALDLGGIGQRTNALIDGASATLTIDPEAATREDFAARARAARTSRSAAERVPDATRVDGRRDANRGLHQYRRSRRGGNSGSRRFATE